jgi:S-adenosylmethionine synthetase
MAIIDGKKEELTQYDLRPSAIIKKLQLAKPQYYKLAKNGHFGRDYIWDN